MSNDILVQELARAALRPFAGILTPAFPITLGLTLALERLLPARPAQKILTVGFCQDFVWMIYEPIIRLFFVNAALVFMTSFCQTHLSFALFRNVTQIPEALRIVLAVLLLDLAFWYGHYLRHRVPLLWRFHSVHHAQRELNFFTDSRSHPFDLLVSSAATTLPFVLLEIRPPGVYGYVIFMVWYSKFVHANIRTNLGILRFVLVTPQSHRIHHSLRPDHRDMNFGGIFSIWDFLCGRQYKGFDEYPDTGIEDREFPHEKTKNWVGLIVTPLIQMMYPLKAR